MKQYGLKNFVPPVFAAGCISGLSDPSDNTPPMRTVTFTDGHNFDIVSEFAEVHDCSNGNYLVMGAHGDLAIYTASDFALTFSELMADPVVPPVAEVVPPVAAPTPAVTVTDISDAVIPATAAPVVEVSDLATVGAAPPETQVTVEEAAPAAATPEPDAPTP